MRDMEQKDWWVVEVESSLRGETGAEEFPDSQDKANSGLIHKVPESLLRDDPKVFYHPQVISFGPYHFTKKSKLDDEMELLKSEVVRYVHHKITHGLEGPNQPQIEEGEKKVDEMLEKNKKNKKKEGYVKKEGGLISVMESFKENEEKVKKSYAREIEVTGEVCAWMITRDACFVLQVLQRFGDIDEDEGPHPQKRVLASIDSILSRKRYNPELTNIVQDVLKMENQLPFWTLTEIRPDIEDWFESALKNLSPIKVADGVNDRQYKPEEKSESHILQLLHDYIVDSQRQRISLDCFTALLWAWFCVFFSCFDIETVDYLSTPYKCMWVCIKWVWKVLVIGIFLVVFSPVIFIMCITNAIGNHTSGCGGGYVRYQNMFQL